MKIDLGCGARKAKDHIGFDAVFASTADVIGDLDRPLPFRSSSFDAARLSHVIEHVNTPVLLLEEVWRICVPGGVVEVNAPHFSSPHLVWGDPTHRRGLSLATFRCFEEDCDWFVSVARFEIVQCRLVKGDSNFGALLRKPWYWPFVLWNKFWEYLVNRSSRSILRYERLLARFVAFQEIRVVLSVRKAARG